MTDRQQGVLWKRRDVFKYRWRPRWFVLHPEQGVLTYYLLTANVAQGLASPTSTTPASHYNARARTFSLDSQVSENTVDYDVVPRGTLDLRGGSITVQANERLSKPDDHFFAFTISAANSSATSSAPAIHLAARTPQGRRVWMERIRSVMARHDPNNPPPPSRRTVNTRAQTMPSSIQEHPNDSESNNNTAENLVVPETASDTSWTATELVWQPVGADQSLYENLSPALTEQIHSKRQRFLPVMDETPSSSTGWTVLFERGDHSAYQKEIPIAEGKSLTLIKSVAFLDHSPRQLLNLLLDSTRRGEFETNLKTEERLARLNAHTVLDYYSYEPVWPTSSREFAVATHWQVLQKGAAGSDRALLLWAFSCPEANQLRPVVEPRHVRADLIISMVLMRPVGDTQCHYTRILCFDPKVGFSQRLSSYITAQQAGQPAVLSRYLQQHEPIPSSRMYGPLEENVIIRDIVNHLPDAAMQPRRIDFNRNSSSSQLHDEEEDGNLHSHGVGGDDDNSQLATTLKTEVPDPPALETQATLLLAPTLIYRILDSLDISGAMIIFVLLAFLAIRQVYVLHLGEILPERTDSPVVGPVTCRFTVDLKGAMRFVNNKKEEREELGQGTAEVTIVHLVASALARALKEVPCLHRRRVIVPWLWIDHVVDASDEPVSVSISENDGGWVTLENVDRIGVQALSDAALEADRKLDATQKIGQCLVVAPPLADTSAGHFASQIEIHASPLLQAGVLVVAVLGHVRVEKGPKPTSPKRPPRSVIDVFLTMKSPSEGDFGTCRRFAEEVQKLVSFPEMMG